MSFRFELATPDDDEALRYLLASTPMPGRITVSFQREPNYFLGCSTMGAFWQVIVARHQPSNQIAGVACRAIRPIWINGQAVDVGYIGQIRVAEPFRSQWLLWRGLEYFRELHDDRRTSLYWGVISDENRIARGLLVEKSSRRFPAVREVAKIHTLGIVLRKPRPEIPSTYQIERGDSNNLAEIAAFLQSEGKSKQFFPVYHAEDFNNDIIRDFPIEDFFVARLDGKIVGVVGLWDQSGYKQSVVAGYDGSLNTLKPIYNLGLRLIGAQPLPKIGEKIYSAYASFICIENNNAEIFDVLLRKAYNLAVERKHAYLMVGLSQDDPLLAIAKQYMHISYFSRAYLASWEPMPALEQRVPYIEIACL